MVVWLRGGSLHVGFLASVIVDSLLDFLPSTSGFLPLALMLAGRISCSGILSRVQHN